MSVNATTDAIRRAMGPKNVVTVYFHCKVDGKHNGSANLLVTNPIVYRQFLLKTLTIGQNQMEIRPLLKSLGGDKPSSPALVEKWGFDDINGALVNTVGAIQPSIAPPVNFREEMAAMMAEGHKQLRLELDSTKREILRET